jgi:hypothetical protein
MALVEVARFVDAPEAQVAAAALRASGIETLIQGELHGQNMFFLQQALGGYGLWVEEEDALDAETLIGACRQAPHEPVENTRRGRSLLAIAAGFLFGG